MTCRLIKSGLSNCPSSPVRAKGECCKSHDLFGSKVMDCSATRILSLSITGRHPQPTGSLIVCFFYSSAGVQSAHSTAPAQQGRSLLHSWKKIKVNCTQRTLQNKFSINITTRRKILRKSSELFFFYPEKVSTFN